MIHSTTLELKLRSHQSRIGMRFAGGHGTTEELVPEDWVPAVLSALKELEAENKRLKEAIEKSIAIMHGDVFKPPLRVREASDILRKALEQ